MSVLRQILYVYFNEIKGVEFINDMYVCTR